MSEGYKNETMAMLVHMANWSYRYETARQNGRFDDWPSGGHIQFDEGKFKSPVDAERFQKVGFERTELIDFLDKYEIPHTLSQNPSCDISNQINLENTNNEIHNSNAASSSHIEMTNASESVGKVHLSAGPRHILAFMIEEARGSVEDRNDVHLVYARMIELASDPGYSPLVIGFVSGKGIMYHSGAVKKPYTYEALRKFFIREAKKAKEKIDG